MRGIHDGPDCTTWPDDKPDPKRGRALLIVVVLATIACGVAALAGVQDGPDGIDPLGAQEATVYAAPVAIGDANVYPNGEIQDGDFGTCSSKQQADCDRKCQAAAPPGYVSISSKCSKKIIPVGGMPGGVLFYSCDCTWVKSPLSAAR